MVVLAVIALVLGTIYSVLDINFIFIEFLAQNTNYILYTLMLLVGISVGLNNGILQPIKTYHVKILVIPFGIILGSFVGGIFCSIILGEPMAESTAVTSCLGWYLSLIHI